MIAFYQALYSGNPISVGFGIDGVSASSVVVKVNGVVQTNGSQYIISTFTPNLTIQFNPAYLPEVGDIIEIYRESGVDNTDREVQFSNLTFTTAESFNLDSDQLFYLIQENNDIISQALKVDSGNELNFNALYGSVKRKIINVANPTDDYDVTTKIYVATKDGETLALANAYTDSEVFQAKIDLRYDIVAGDLTRVKKTGDIMSGNLDMNFSNNVINIADPGIADFSSRNAINVRTVKSRMDAQYTTITDETDLKLANYLLKAGDSMSGDINFSGYWTATNLRAPLAHRDAVTKMYVDNIVFGTSVINGFVGLNEAPSITDNGDGSITLGVCCVTLYDNPNSLGEPARYDITGGVLTLTNNETNYIVADYNGGSPIVRVTLDVDEITESDIAPIYTIYREDNYLHTINWDTLGQNLANKIHQSIVKTNRYRRESGLALSYFGTRNLSITEGIIWTGGVRHFLDSLDSVTDNIYYYKHIAGTWTLSLVSQFENIYYDDGTDLVELTANRYAVCWIYRGVEDQKHLYMTLGTDDYTLSQAEASQPPVPPDAISSHAVLVAKIIVQKGSNTPASIQGAFTQQFSFSGLVSHLDLINLQGVGTGVTYGHLSDQAQTIFGIKTFSDSIAVDTISEGAGADGVTVDGVKLKDGGGYFTGNVGIGRVPTCVFDVYSPSGGIVGIIESSTSASAVFRWKNTVNEYGLSVDSSGNFGIYEYVGGKTVFNITPDGVVNMPNQASFQAWKDTSLSITNTATTIPFEQITENVNGTFASGVWTPDSSISSDNYIVTLNLLLSNSDATSHVIEIAAYAGTGNRVRLWRYEIPSSDSRSISISYVVKNPTNLYHTVSGTGTITNFIVNGTNADFCNWSINKLK